MTNSKELAKILAQSVTRRGALKKFGSGVAAAVIASLGFVDSAQADPKRKKFHCICNLPNAGCEPTSPMYNESVTYGGSSLDKYACGGGGLHRPLFKLVP